MPDQPTPLLEQHASRREVIKKAAYITPAILTLAAVPAFAAKGSGVRTSGEKDSGRLDNKLKRLDNKLARIGNKLKRRKAKAEEE